MTARRPHESVGTDEGNGPGDPEQPPMERFKALARGLLNVSREALREEEEKYNIENAARKKGADR